MNNAAAADYKRIELGCIVYVLYINKYSYRFREQLQTFHGIFHSLKINFQILKNFDGAFVNNTSNLLVE